MSGREFRQKDGGQVLLPSTDVGLLRIVLCASPIDLPVYRLQYAIEIMHPPLCPLRRRGIRYVRTSKSPLERGFRGV